MYRRTSIIRTTINVTERSVIQTFARLAVEKRKERHSLSSNENG